MSNLFNLCCGNDGRRAGAGGQSHSFLGSGDEGERAYRHGPVFADASAEERYRRLLAEEEAKLRVQRDEDQMRANGLPVKYSPTPGAAATAALDPHAEEMQRQREEIEAARKSLEARELELQRRQEMMMAQAAAASEMPSIASRAGVAKGGENGNLKPSPVSVVAPQMNGLSKSTAPAATTTTASSPVAPSSWNGGDTVMTSPIVDAGSSGVAMPSGESLTTDVEDSEDELEMSHAFVPQPTADRSIHTGVDFFSSEQYALAKCHLKRGVLLAAQHNEPLMLARAHGNLANVYETLRRSARAVKHYESCIRLLQQLGEQRRESFILSNAMVSYVQLKRYEDALRLAQRKQSITRDPEKKTETEFWIQKLRKAAAGDVDLDFRDSRNAERQNLIVTQNKSLYFQSTKAADVKSSDMNIT